MTTELSPPELWSVFQKHRMGCSDCSIVLGPCAAGLVLKERYEKAADERSKKDGGYVRKYRRA